MNGKAMTGIINWRSFDNIEEFATENDPWKIMKVDYVPFLGMVSFHSYVKLSESIR